MDIEINNNKQQASFKNGKFYHTFTPSTANQTVKLYHMGCVGDTRLNRIQLEQGTEPTGFVEPKNTTNTISGIFKNLRDLDVLMKDPESDFWTRIKKTAKGTIEEYHTNTIKNEIVKTAEGIVETLSKKVDGVTTSVATVSRTVDSISSNITSLEGNVLKKDEISITPNGVTLGSGKVIDGRTITSLITTQPENIKAITDKFIITPANENLVLPEYRDTAKSNSRDTWLTSKINVGDITIGDEYIFIGEIYPEIGTTTPHNINFLLEYKSGQYGTNWITSRIISANGYSNERNYTLRVNVGIRDIEYIRLGIQQETSNNFKTLTIYNAQIYKKKSAELIVDGSIEGRQIKAETLETGHHKAGSITSEIIAANAVKAKHVLIDDGLIDNLVSHNAFISKLWAQDAFIRSLQTVKISATQLDTDWLSAYTGDIGGFRIGKNPNQPGDFWLTGSNNFNCGLNPGHNIGTRGAQIWAAWGNRWDKAGNNAWWVDGQGVMHCYNRPILSKGLDVSGGNINMHGSNIEGYADENKNKTTVIWWSQINRVKSSVSDKRFKTNIKPTKVKAVDLLNKIEMVEFNWKKDNRFEKIGAIAQQIQSVEESLVVHDMDDKQTYNDYLRINYYDTIPYLIKAVQELSEENNKLKKQIGGINQWIINYNQSI